MTSRAFLPLVLLLLSSAKLAGQEPAPAAALRQTQRVPVTVALMDALPLADADFLVQRRPAMSPHDVILLRAGATGAQLSDAVQTLLAARQAGGDLPAVDGFMRVRPHESRAGKAVSHRQFPWAERVVRDVGKAPVMQLDGIGRVRAVQIWLPPQHGSPGRS